MNKYLARPWHLYRRQSYFKNYLAICREKGLPSKLHVGCGNRPIQGWCNIDVAHLTKDTQYADATAPLPFNEGSFEYIFSEHFIEHLPYEKGLSFFREAHRVLKKGGILRTATPDLKFLMSLYLGSEAHTERYLHYTSEKFTPHQPKSQVASINLTFYGWGHAFIYDAEFMKKVLLPLGFKNFKIFKPGKSETLELTNLEQHGLSVPPDINEMETFVLEATKI